MTIDRIFYLYMVLMGAAAGAVLATVPRAHEFSIKPFFWILIAVGLFDGVLLLRASRSEGPMLTMNMRVIGFGIGIALMIAIALLAGVPFSLM